MELRFLFLRVLSAILEGISGPLAILAKTNTLEKQLKIFSEFFEPLETDFALKTFIKRKSNNNKPGILISIDDADKSILFALKFLSECLNKSCQYLMAYSFIEY